MILAEITTKDAGVKAFNNVVSVRVEPSGALLVITERDVTMFSPGFWVMATTWEKP